MLWPLSASLGPQGGCDTCSTLVEDFYLWPEYDGSANPNSVDRWESDLISWILQPSQVQAGASLQCNTDPGVGWQYNYQTGPNWQTFPGPITQDCVGNLPFGTIPNGMGVGDTSFYVTPNGSNSLEPGMIVRIDSEEILCTAVSGNECTNAIRAWADSNQGNPQTHLAGVPWMGSVHVQYHVSLDPGNNGCQVNGSSVDCAFIDYLTLNNVQYNFDTTYNGGNGTQTSTGTYFGIPVPVPPGPGYGIDRVYNQFQMDVPSSVTSPTEVGEYVDQVNVTASWGIQAAASCAASSCP